MIWGYTPLLVLITKNALGTPSCNKLYYCDSTSVFYKINDAIAPEKNHSLGPNLKQPKIATSDSCGCEDDISTEIKT